MTHLNYSRGSLPEAIERDGKGEVSKEILVGAYIMINGVYFVGGFAVEGRRLPGLHQGDVGGDPQ